MFLSGNVHGLRGDYNALEFDIDITQQRGIQRHVMRCDAVPNVRNRSG